MSVLDRPTPQVGGIRLLVGLGNPVPEYGTTRHNAGARFIEMLCQQYRLSLKTDQKLNARTTKWLFKGNEYRILLPNTYMNHSGQSVGTTARYYKILPQSILIVHDELDLKPGAFQFKFGGGHAGHNGLRDIFHHLQSSEFHRLRLGIGHPGNKDQVADYVLNKASREEDKLIKEASQQALSQLADFLQTVKSEAR